MLKSICLSLALLLTLNSLAYAEEHEGGGGGGSKPSGGKGQDASQENNPMYLQLQEMQIPVIQNRRVKGVVVLNLTLDLGTGESRKMMEGYRTFIHDKLYWDVYDSLGIIWSPDFKLNAAGLKKHLMKTVRKYFEEKDVKDVLIMDIREIERKDGKGA